MEHVPLRYDGRRPVPLVLDLHGSGGTPSKELDTSKFDELADEEGFLVAAPRGSGEPRGWVTFTDSATGLAETDDEAVLAVLDRVLATRCVDVRRVYAVGFSNGAAMAALLACTASSRLAAAVMVAGAVYPGSPCAKATPVPVLAVQGGADNTFEGFLQFAPAGCCNGLVLWPPADAMTAWARHAGCRPAAQRRGAAAFVLEHRWEGCRSGTEVALVTVARGGHEWPEVLPDRRRTTTVVWTFLSRHARR